MSKFASLTSGLLARKGLAEPVAIQHSDDSLARVEASGPDFRTQGAFGRRSPVSAYSAMIQREPEPQAPAGFRSCHASEVAGGAVAGEPSALQVCPDGAVDPERLFHVSLRLRRRRFVKLKLSSALLRRPTQDIMGEALDLWFERLPPGMLGDCPCIKGR